ncbi:response regulator transcription factor [Candidatus Nitrospira bockiana]
MAGQHGSRISILIVDDYLIWRTGLRGLLEKHERIQVVGEAETAVDAVRQAIDLAPHVVLMDIRLPDGSGIDACRQILASCPGTRVLFLTAFPDDKDLLIQAVLAGGVGCFIKDVDDVTLVKAIEAVASGQCVFDRATTDAVRAEIQAAMTKSPVPPSADLSPQEHSVLCLVAKGKTNKEIAAILSLSDHTVRNYLHRAYRKLHIARRSQAAALYADHR